MKSSSHLALFGRAIALLMATCLLAACAARNFHVLPPGEGVATPRYIDLQEPVSAATMHFPPGAYTLYAADNNGYYYKAPKKIAEHTAAGNNFHDGGLFVPKQDQKKLRGYVYWAGALTHVGSFPRAKRAFRDGRQAPRPAPEETTDETEE